MDIVAMDNHLRLMKILGFTAMIDDKEACIRYIINQIYQDRKIKYDIKWEENYIELN